MYKRIRDGLLDPKKIINFFDDKFFDVFIFILFFAILLTAPTLFKLINFEISFDTKSEIVDLFRGKDINYEIKNGELISLSDGEAFVLETNGLVFIVGEKDNDNTYKTVLKFEKESLMIEVGGFKTKVLDYLDYDEIANINLDSLTKGKNESWEKVFKLVNNYVEERPLIFIVLPVIMQLLSNILSMILVALIVSLGALLRLRGVVKFGTILKLNIYCLEPFIIGALIDSLFGFSLLYIIGVVVTFIYSYITQIEIFKKVYSHHTEG